MSLGWLTPEKSGIFIKTDLILKAKIPVIKMETNGKFKFKKVDISLIDEKHHGIESSNLTVKFLKKYPILKQIFLVLKQVIFLADLNDPSKVN